MWVMLINLTRTHARLIFDSWGNSSSSTCRCPRARWWLGMVDGKRGKLVREREEAGGGC
jgi:hypothetical protein